ncbi:MAG: hypothetical protein IKB34_00785, partial [Clostridia bacterium]|nr:hypothetical protein [Clostridia bacterium]
DYWAETADDLDTEQYGYTGEVTRLSLLEDSMYWLALSATSTLPDDTTGKYIPGSYNIAGATNNWNGVCNGGLMAAALALANVERYSEQIQLYLGEAVNAIERGMWVYAPDGGYEEGPGYWSYGTTYSHIFISCLDTACGKNYGIYNAPGYGHSVYFTTYLGSKNTTWGFHDGGSGSADTSIASWFALKDNDPNVNAIRRQAIENGWKGVSLYDIMYFNPHIMTSTITLTLDSFYSLDNIMTFRSSWDANNNLFTGLHGGDNAASHGDLDIGNFVINANGTFLINDLGSDAYNVSGYFGTYRWSYYRKRAEGQNTLVMLPHGESWDGRTGIPCITDEKANKAGNTNPPKPDQISNAISEVLRYESGKASAIGVVDMDVAYAEMTDGIRGLYMTDNRETIIIQDEAVFSKGMDIWWSAHTQGNIEIADDGKSATITRSGITLYAEIVTDMAANVTFTAMDANSFDGKYVGDTTDSQYYTDDIEYSRAGIYKLCIKAENVTELRLAVVFRVIDGPNSSPERGTLYTWKNIDQWTVD